MRHATLPAPGGEAELLEWLGDFYSHRLDRAHPLWETTLLDGLADGRWALATKVHHCLVDGISGASVTSALLDAEPDRPPARRASQRLWRRRARTRTPSAARCRSSTARWAAASTRRCIRASSPRPCRGPGRWPRWSIREELIGAPHTSLNEPIGGTRRLAAVDVPLEDLKQIKRELGGTVNDVVLAATAGGLRRLFEHRGEGSTWKSVRAMVPVSVREAGERSRSATGSPRCSSSCRSPSPIRCFATARPWRRRRS